MHTETPIPANPTLPPEPQPPKNPNPNPVLKAPEHRRTGKIARLPKPIREKINLMLQDGIHYADIIKKVAADVPGLTPNNLSRWHSGGYQEWLEEQAWLEETNAKLDFASKILNQENADLLNEASLRIALTRMYHLLLQFDPLLIKDSLSESASAYSRLLNALCKLTDGLTRLERHRQEQTLYKTTLFG